MVGRRQVADGFALLLIRCCGADVKAIFGFEVGKSIYKEPIFMKRSVIVLTVIAILSMSCLAFAAEDGAAIYKAKCAGCHGPDGAGKVGPAVKGTSLSDAQIDDLLTKGTAGKKAPHAKAISGLTDDQAKAVAAYVKSLK
jgi:cytochrome c553